MSDDSIDRKLSDFFSRTPRYEFDVVLRGYDRHQVHALMEQVDKTLDGTANERERITPDIIRATTLGVVLRGYDRHQVDAALLDIIERLKA